MSLQWDTIAAYARELWRGRHNSTLAERLGVPRTTAKSWLTGKRRVPIGQMRAMAEALRHEIGIAKSALSFLEVEIQRRECDPPRRRGFFVVKDWDGSGIRTNRQWRGGRGRPPTANDG
jgi:transcriptional regulator with XRE-family HTH domain